MSQRNAKNDEKQSPSPQSPPIKGGEAYSVPSPLAGEGKGEGGFSGERQGNGKKEIALELEERLAGQLLAKSQAMVSDAFQLSVQSQAMIVIAQQRAASLITIFITLIIAIMAAVSFMFGRSVAKPIGKLHEGTEIIGAGNLNYRVGTPAKDEIGQLSRAFDRMTESLRQQAVVLEESENKFRDMAEKSIVGVYLIQDGVFRYANPMLAEIFGYSVEELIDKKGPKDLVLPEDWPIVEENLRKRISGEIESINYDFRGITKDKETIYVEVYGSKTAYRGRPAVIGTLLDITEQKMAKGALQASEEKFRNIVERSYDVIVTTDTTGRI
ncbi:MAG: PAS domain S-box protein, partial [Desulfobacterales bacterium]|nr:PAS domain S-box protein [Desulfobacterales bacterium]